MKCATGWKVLGQKSVITVTVKENTATPFAAATSHIAHWIPEFLPVVAQRGEILKAEAAHFRGESATQN